MRSLLFQHLPAHSSDMIIISYIDPNQIARIVGDERNMIYTELYSQYFRKSYARISKYTWRDLLCLCFKWIHYQNAVEKILLAGHWKIIGREDIITRIQIRYQWVIEESGERFLIGKKNSWGSLQKVEAEREVDLLHNLAQMELPSRKWCKKSKFLPEARSPFMTVGAFVFIELCEKGLRGCGFWSFHWFCCTN